MADNYKANPKSQVPGNQPGKMRLTEEVKSSDFLPQYINTKVNQKILQSTLDQMISKSTFETLDNWVGKPKAGWYDQYKDQFIDTADTTKRYYNGSPGIVIKDIDNVTQEITTFTDTLDNIANNVKYTGNRPAGKNQTNTYSPPIDYDMFANFSNYYWCRDDLPLINLKPSAAFDPDNMVGQTYYTLATSDLGNVEMLNGFKIKFAPNAIDILTGNGSNATFTLSNSGYGLEVVLLDGTRQTSGYTIVGTTLQFSSPPGNNVQIQVQHFNMSDINYYANTYIVQGVGKSIELIQTRDEQDRIILSRKMLYSPYQPSGFDMEDYDTTPYDYTKVENRLHEYVCMESGAQDGNAWSRVNQWYHYNAIVSACTLADVDFTTYANDTTRARRPIIQFEKDMILYDYGVHPTSVTQKFAHHRYNVDFVTKLFDGTTIDNTGTANYTLFSSVNAWSASTEYQIGDIVKEAVGTDFWYFEARQVNKNADPLDSDLVVDTNNWLRVYDHGLQNGDRILFYKTGDPNYLNRVFEVSGVGSNIQLTLLLVPEENDKLHTIHGPNFPDQFNGADIVWNNSWVRPQQKTSKGLAPKFDLFDEDANEIISYYNNNDFEGNEVFNYKINNAATVDFALGFAASYKTAGGSSELEFEHPLDNKTYKYDINSIPKDILGELHYGKRLNTFDDSFTTHGAWKYSNLLPNTYYASESSTVTTDDGTAPNYQKTLNVGRNDVQPYGEEFIFGYDATEWVVYEKTQSTPKNFQRLDGQNPNIYFYANSTITIRKDYVATEATLSFVKETDGTTAAPGITVTDNGNTITVEVAASGYDKAFLYKATGAGSGSVGKVYVVDEVFYASSAFNRFMHEVTVNGSRTENYNLLADTTIVTGLKLGDTVEIRYQPKAAKTDDSKWNNDLMLSNNPLGQRLGTHTHADLMSHFTNKIKSAPDKYDRGIGLSDYYIGAKETCYGGTILKHANTHHIGTYVKQNSRNTIEAIRNVMNAYDRFKNQFANKAKQVNDTGTYTTTRELVNETFAQLNVGKDNTFRNAATGMAHWYNAKTQTISITDNTTVFYLNNSANTSVNQNIIDHIYVYLKEYDSTASVYIEKLQVKGLDYTLDGNKLTLTNAAVLNANVPAELVIDYYNKNNNSFVPWSAPKLQLQPAIQPTINGTVLKGHDCAEMTVVNTTNLYRPSEADYDVRTAVLWDLENRIYAGMADYHQSANYSANGWNDSIEWRPRFPFYDKHGSGDHAAWKRHYRTAFEYWLDSNGKDYPSLLNISPDRPNYSNQTDADGVQLPGTQEAVLEYLTGTRTPKDSPWEMLGWREKPAWWDANYSWTDLAKRSKLLSALYKGHFNDPSETMRTHQKYKINVDLSQLINTSGVQTDIVSAGFVTAGNNKLDWEIGDGSSAEDEFRKTSAYNFALVEANFRNSPHNFWVSMRDPSSRIEKNGVDKNSKTRKFSSVADPVYGGSISNGTLDNIVIGAQGTGYTNPTVTVTGDGEGATATAFVDAGKVVGIKITNGGYGYTNAGIEITDTTGRGASATAELVNNGTYTTSGLDALIWYFNDTSIDPVVLDARNLRTTAQPIIGIEGYTDKNIVRVRTLGNSVKAPFVMQDNDIELALHKSAAKVKLNFTSVRITKTAAGYKISGYETDKKYLQYLQANTSGSTTKVVYGNLEVDIFINWTSSDEQTINYDKTFTDLNSISNFLAGRTEWLRSKGLQTFEFRGVVNDFLEWASSANINDVYHAHAENSILFNDSLNRFLDSIFVTNSSVLVENLGEDSKTEEVNLSNVKAIRNDLGAELYTEDLTKILRINVDFVQYEHALVLANRTLFADEVYRPDLGMSYDSYKLEGRRTLGWTGSPSSKGYLIDQDRIVANIDSSVREIEDDYFQIDSNALNQQKRKIAKTTVGFNQPTWANTLPISDDNTFDYYRSSIATKGTHENFKGIARHQELVDPATDTFSVDEEWLFKTSDFAADNATYIELEFNSDLIKTNPQGVKLTSSGSADSDLDDIITVKKNDKRLITKLDTPNQFTLGNDYYHQDESTFGDFEDWLKNAGYPLVSEVDEQALTINDIVGLYDDTKDYATVLQWDDTYSYKNGDKVRYQDKVYQCNVASTGLDTTRNPITWNGTVNNPVILPGNSLIIDSNTVNLTNNITTTTFDQILVTSNSSPVVNGGDTLVLDGTAITFTKSSTTTTYPDFAVAGSTVNPTIQGSATATLIIQGTTVNFNDTVATTINVTALDAVSDAFTDGTISTITASDRIAKIAAVRSRMQTVHGNVSARSKLASYFSNSGAGFDTSVLVTEYGATADATLQTNIQNLLLQDVTIINEKAGTTYVTSNVLNGSTPVNVNDENTAQTAYELGSYDDAIKDWIANSTNDAISLSDTTIVTTASGTAYKLYDATAIAQEINDAGISNIAASLSSNQLTITRTGRTSSDKNLTIGTGTVNSSVDNAATTFPSSGTLTHTGPENTTTSNTAQLTITNIIDQINAANIAFINATLHSGNQVRVTKSPTTLSPNLTISGTAVTDLGGGFTTGTINGTSTTSTSAASLSVGLVAQLVNDANITGVTASVVDNRIVITSTNSTGIMTSTQAALDLGINSNILSVTRTATTASSANTFDVSEWTEIDEPLLEYIWVADDTGLGYTSVDGSISVKYNGWNMFKVMDYDMYATKICAAVTTGTGNDAEVQCNKAHNLQKGDIVLLLNTNCKPIINGYHFVTGTDTASDAKFFIDEFIDTDATFAKVLVLRPVRFSTDAQRDLATSSTHYSFATSDKVWVDGTSQFKVYKKDTGNSWLTERTQGDNHVKPTTLQRSILHNNNVTIAQAESYDPFKGIIPGLADIEIDYRTINDPAIYTNSTDSIAQINQQQAWGRDHLGEVWWNTNKAVYIDYEQSTPEYRTQYWGTLFKGGSIDCYEWTRSDVAPDQYEQSVAGGKVLDGVVLTGTPLSELDAGGNTLYYYTEVEEYDSSIGANVTYYYFWVKDKTTVPLGTKRTSSVSNVANLIKDPTAQNVRWLTASGKDSFVVANLRNLATANTVLQIANISNDDSSHKHWTNIVENQSTVPEYFHRRLKDGLRGNNDNKKQKDFKGQYNVTTSYSKGEVVSIDAPVSNLTLTVGAKTADNRYYNKGSANAFFVNNNHTDIGQILTLQRGKTYIFDQNDASNVGHALVFSTVINAVQRGLSYYETSTDGVYYYLDNAQVTLSAYNTALAAGTAQDKKVTFTPSATTPETLWFGCFAHRNMGNQFYVVDEELDEKPSYYMSLVDSNVNVRPQTNRRAWRRIFDATDIDNIEETIMIPEERHVPDLELHPYDRVGESVRPSRTWFNYKNASRREVITQINFLLQNTLLVDDAPEYKTLLDIQIQHGSKIYQLADYWNHSDWYADDFDAFVQPNRTVSEITPLLTSGDASQLTGRYNGEYILAKDVLHADGIVRDSIFRFDNTDTAKWVPVYKQKGTIQLSEQLWDSTAGAYGFDSQGFDNGGYDSDPTHELVKILDVLRENLLDIFDYNKVWFSAVYDALGNQNNQEWIKKSTKIVPKLNKQVNTTKRIGYDAVPILEDYIQTNKPFTSKISDSAGGNSSFVDQKSVLDSTGLVITEQSRTFSITDQRNEHLANTFTENLGETAVIVNTPLPFDDVDIVKTFNSVNHTVTRNPIITSWKFSTGDVVSISDAINDTLHLVNVPANVEKVAQDRDFVYIRTSGVTDAVGGPGWTVAPDTEIPVADQRPNNTDSYNFKIPQVAKSATTKPDRGYGVIGVLTNGVAIKSPRDKEQIGAGAYYRNEGELRKDKMDPNNGTSWCSIGDYEPPVEGVYYHYDMPGEYAAVEDATKHSKIIGWALDGYPIYGPYGFTNTDGTGAIKKMAGGYSVKTGARTGVDAPSGNYDGSYTADYDYNSTGADLDQYNGRFAVTPEFPDGVYHYHATPGVYPYFIGPQFYGETNGDQIYSNSAKQIKPYLPNEIKPIDTHDVTVNGGTFSNVDDDFTYYYDAQTFINRYETRGSDQYFVDFNEALRIMVQTNASGSTASADTRSFVYFQNDDGDIFSTVTTNARKSNTNGAVSDVATEISVNNIERFYNPNLVHGYYAGSLRSTDQAKFGTGSLKFTNNTDQEKYTPFSVTSTVGRVAFWLYMDTTAADARIVSADGWAIRRSAAGEISMINDSASTVVGTGLSGGWNHVQIIKNGGTTIDVSINGGSATTVTGVNNLMTIGGLEFGFTTRLTTTYTGSAAGGVYIDSFKVDSSTTNVLPSTAETEGLVFQNWEPYPFADSEMPAGAVYLGHERIEYKAVDLINGKLLFCTRGAKGTAIISHNSGGECIDAGPDLEIPTHRQFHQFGDTLLPAYNDSGASLGSGAGVGVEAKFIRGAGRGDFF